MSVDLTKLAEAVFADMVYPRHGTEDAPCDQHNRDLFHVLARQVVEAILDAVWRLGPAVFTGDTIPINCEKLRALQRELLGT